MPFGLSLDDLKKMLHEVSPGSDFDVVLPAGRPLDPANDPAGVRERLERVADAGASIISASITATSVDDYCEQLATLADLAHLTSGE